jgi:ankyrin repeat protein
MVSEHVFQKVLHHVDDTRLDERCVTTGFSAIHVICDNLRVIQGDRNGCYKQAVAKLRALLRRQANADPDVTTHEGYTAFLLASRAGFSEAFDVLLEYGADISITATSGMGVAAAATCAGSLRSLQKLSQLPVPLDWTQTFHLERTDFFKYERGVFGPSGCGILHAAAALRNSSVLMYLASIPELSDRLDEATESGYTPLHLAAANGHEKNVRFLLQNGANKDALTLHTKWTPLYQAVWGGHTKVVSMLIDSGAALISPTYEQSLEQAAKHFGNQQVVDIISTARSRIVEQFETTSRLLEEFHHSILNGDMEACRAYIERGALALGQFSCGCTPLIRAINMGRVDIANLLLDHDASTAGIVCMAHLIQYHPQAWSQPPLAAFIAVHNPVLNSALSSLLGKCLVYDSHWAWSVLSLVYVAVEVNPGAIRIIKEHIDAHWEWYA